MKLKIPAFEPLKMLIPASSVLNLIPRPLQNALAAVAAQLGAQSGGAKQLRKNLHLLGLEVVPRSLIVANLAGYYRYFMDILTLANWSEDEIRERCIVQDPDGLIDAARSEPIIGALVHAGNWDLAGARVALEGVNIITVAERLKDDRVWEFFRSCRERLGMHILPAEPGVFHRLEELTKTRPGLYPLLADRDISGRGIEVDFGARALVGAGPAALALKTGSRLAVVYLSDGKEAGKYVTRVVLREVKIEAGDDVNSLTQRWVNLQRRHLLREAASWHMLQKLYVAHLDPKRLERARARAKERPE